MNELLSILPTDTPRTWRLVGELDASNADTLIDGLKEQLDAGGDLVLDLAELSFVDSMGLRSLLRMASSLDTNGKLVLSSPQRSVFRTMELVGLNQLPNIAIVNPVMSGDGASSDSAAG